MTDDKTMTVEALAYRPIDRDEEYDRDYIPMPGGWEIQTKGKGSTYRLAEPDDSRLAIPDSPYLRETLERMARDINAAWATLAAALQARDAEVAELRTALRELRDYGADSYRIDGLAMRERADALLTPHVEPVGINAGGDAEGGGA